MPIPAVRLLRKRKVHFGMSIVTEHMTRDGTLNLLEGLSCSSEDEPAADGSYSLRKMGWSEAQLEDYAV